MSRKLAEEGWRLGGLGERIARPRWRGTRLTAAEDHTRDAYAPPVSLEVGSARAESDAGTSATVVALMPRAKIHVAPSRAAEGGSALQLQSKVIRGTIFGIVLPVKL